MRDLDQIAAIEALYRSNPRAAALIRRAIFKYAERTASKLGRVVKIMDFCGTHEWTITHYGLRALMPESVELVAGPGCPVCITPSFYIEVAVKLALEGIDVYTYGDAYRLPALRDQAGARSLAEARTVGGNVRVVYSFLEAVRESGEKGRDSAFLGIGFETTAPSYAELFLKGAVPKNLGLITVVRLTPPVALYALRNVEGVSGVIAPGHVSTITGAGAWAALADELGLPTVVSGFEPIDVLISIAEILRQLSEGRAELFIEYRRAVTMEGNVRARRRMSRVLETVDAAWRGIGFVEQSGMRLREEFRDWDALERFGFREPTREEWVYDLPPGCRCADIVIGRAKPTDCPLFQGLCNLDRPYGPCMVGTESTCAIWARFGGGLSERIARELGVD